MCRTRFQFYSEKVTGFGGYKDILVFIRMGQKMAILIKKNLWSRHSVEICHGNFEVFTGKYAGDTGTF